MTRAVSDSAQKIRPTACRKTDIAALRAIAQAAVDVELFTIPLYMGSLYSIVGMHQITGKRENFYENRWWPGPATTPNPDHSEKKHPFNTEDNVLAFNTVFSVFVEEMLHLQMAANIASAMGVTPSFTSSKLQNEGHGWTCYGPEEIRIPYIVDLTDVKLQNLKNDNPAVLEQADPSKVRVNIAELSVNQILLFMAIEQPEHVAKKHQKPRKIFPFRAI